jgi:inosine/xanthosine triphosphate pyrophosphatase family protein
MMSKPSIIFVTGNKNKLKEVQAILGTKYEVIAHKVDCKIF